MGEKGAKGLPPPRRADGDGARSRIPSQDCPGVTHHRRDLSEQVALGKSRPPKGHLSPSQVSPSQVSPSQVSPSQVSPSQLSPSQVSRFQVSQSQVSPSQMSLSE